MNLSENVIWAFVAVVVVSAAIYFIPSAEILYKIAGWLFVGLFLANILGLGYGIIKFNHFSATLFSIMLMSLVFSILMFTFPWFAESKSQKRECRAIGGEWVYLGEQENLYGCRKEYQSCGPDESRPGFTICETNFKRVYP